MTPFLRKSFSILFFMAATHSVQAQQWKPAMGGLLENQAVLGVSHFEVNFKTDLMGQDWMYGRFFDTDTLNRCIAYREGSSWIFLPFSVSVGSRVVDIEMQGDTLCLLGSFVGIDLENSNDTLANTFLLKWFNDSLWGLGGNRLFREA